MTETFEEYFQLTHQTVPIKFTPFSQVLNTIFTSQNEENESMLLSQKKLEPDAPGVQKL